MHQTSSSHRALFKTLKVTTNLSSSPALKTVSIVSF
jgi:hypothetical protein